MQHEFEYKGFTISRYQQFGDVSRIRYLVEESNDDEELVHGLLTKGQAEDYVDAYIKFHNH